MYNEKNLLIVKIDDDSFILCPLLYASHNVKQVNETFQNDLCLKAYFSVHKCTFFDMYKITQTFSRVCTEKSFFFHIFERFAFSLVKPISAVRIE